MKCKFFPNDICITFGNSDIFSLIPIAEISETLNYYLKGTLKN